MSDADATIAALRSGFDELAALVSGFGDDELAHPSGAAEWDVSQVLSHLGSGAEIAQNTLQVSLEGKPNPGMDFNRPVWARYDGASPRERAEWFLRANEALTQSYESLSEETRAEPARRPGLPAGAGGRGDGGRVPAQRARAALLGRPRRLRPRRDRRAGGGGASSPPGSAGWRASSASRPRCGGKTAVIAVTTTEPGAGLPAAPGRADRDQPRDSRSIPTAPSPCPPRRGSG